MDNEPLLSPSPTPELIPFIADTNRREASEGKGLPEVESGQDAGHETLFTILKRAIASLLKSKPENTQTPAP